MNESADTNKPAEQRRRIDPRFSPAFQAGYDPYTHRREPPSAPLRDESNGEWEDGSVDEWGEAEGAPAVTPNSPPPHSVGSTSINQGTDGAFPGPPGDAGQPALTGPVEDDDEPAPWWWRINPWIIVLWVLGVVFIAGGVAVTYLLGGMDPFGQNSSSGYVISALFQMAMFGVPLLVVLGLATITASFVILAIRWRSP